MNNKGFTTVEVLLCFIVISIVMMSMFSTISSFNEKRAEESYRSKVIEYKNQITNLIQEDIVKRGLQFVNIKTEGSPNPDAGRKYTTTLTFGDGTQKELVVYQRFTKTENRDGTTADNDSFYIQYGLTNEKIQYDLPDLGSIKGGFYTTTEIDDSGNTITINHFDLPDSSGKCHDSSGNIIGCHISQDLQINNVEISVSNEADLGAESRIFNLYIGFYHPDLGTKYAINIVAPINYNVGQSDAGTWPFCNGDGCTDDKIHLYS